MSAPKLWVSIWFSPRKAAKAIMKREQVPLLLVMIKGLVFNLDISASNFLGRYYGLLWILGGSLIGAVVTGLILVGIWSQILTWVGKWFGGIGDVEDVRKIFAWSAVFDAITLLLYAVLTVRMGNGFFQMDAVDITFFDFGLFMLGTVVKFWFYAYLIVAISEVHAFSKWRSFFTILCFLVPLALLGLS
jgi:hypothetical protein